MKKEWPNKIIEENIWKIIFPPLHILTNSENSKISLEFEDACLKI